MMMEPCSELQTARRRLEEIPGYYLIKDLYWDGNVSCWVLKFGMTVSVGSNPYQIPDTTEWYAVLSENYPWGKVQVYPAKENGISLTFQHQHHNNLPTKNEWRSGDLCLSTTFGSFSLRGFNSEPMQANDRLFWHIWRCKLWLQAASNNELAPSGQLFEMPYFPLSASGKFIFSENQQTYQKLISSNKTSGLADVTPHEGKTSFFVAGFSEFNGNLIYSNVWNTSIDRPSAKRKKAVWMLLDFVPVLCPWEAPVTWGDLYTIGSKNGIDIKKQLAELFIKGYKHDAECLLLGFLVPERIGGPAVQIHWQPICLPFKRRLKGFRPGQEVEEIARRGFNKNKTIDWMESQNSDINTISARGRHSKLLSEANILLIGAGAVGSVLAECLVRGCCKNLVIVDNDKVEIGNMSRHTLTLSSLDQCKAQQLAKRLNDIFPGINVTFKRSYIEQVIQSDRAYLGRFDLIIDATGSDQALHALSNAISGSNKKFVSVSLGLHASKLFYYQFQGCQDLESEFKVKFSPWLEQELERTDENSLPREGIGCWHPLFPARIDDVWMMSSAAIKLVEAYFLGSSRPDTFIVLAKRGDQTFDGIDVIRN